MVHFYDGRVGPQDKAPCGQKLAVLSPDGSVALQGVRADTNPDAVSCVDCLRVLLKRARRE